jgi:hypothetical protein
MSVSISLLTPLCFKLNLYYSIYAYYNKMMSLINYLDR